MDRPRFRRTDFHVREVAVREGWIAVPNLGSLYRLCRERQGRG